MPLQGIRFRPDAFYDVRRSPRVVAEVDSIAANGAAKAGPGFSWHSQQGRRAPQGRWRSIIFPATFEARRRNARHNVLVRVLPALRR
ncbi:hypothetical protein [Rhodococcoides fascians]|uniref:hypothetical protein n=1 Tax=Rhodococcoides fascians TaxID=1828 RepID=UPI000AA7BCE7|nr:hypothetical protein [Rhodococcus fascians]